MTQRRFLSRLVLAILGGLFVGWLVLASTVDRVFANTAPRFALAWNPDSADANTRAADLFLSAHPAAAGSPEIRRYAERALVRQPLMPKAARLLGLGAATHGEQARAERLMAYAEAMSRRDLPTELFLIETNVQKGDIVGALRHYDRAMRVSTGSWTTLFPILNGAAQASAVWQPLLTLIARRPPWARPFLDQFVPQAISPGVLVAIAHRLDLDRHPSPDSVMLQVIEQRLVDLAAFHPAATLYDHAHGLSAGSGILLHNRDFEQPGGADPFDWIFMDDPNLSAERAPSPVAGEGAALFLTAANGRGGDVATQLLVLPPGAYRLRARIGAIARDKLAYPQVVVRCAVDAREFLHQPLAAAPANGAMWQTSFTIPADCPAQRLVIQARSSMEAQDIVPWIDTISLNRQGGH